MVKIYYTRRNKMKKITRLLLVIVLAGSLVGCFQNNERSNTVDTTKQASQDSDNKSISANRLIFQYLKQMGKILFLQLVVLQLKMVLLAILNMLPVLFNRKAVVICIESKQFKAIPKHMIHYWNLLMKNVVKMQDRN